MTVTSVCRVRPARLSTTALRSAGGLLVGAMLIVVFLRLVNVRSVYRHLSHLNVAFAGFCAVAFLAAYAVRAMRWRWLLRPRQVAVGRAIAIYQVATFLNWLLPIRGGEIAKVLLLRRTDGIPAGDSLATVSMDKTMDLLPALVLVAVVPFVGLRLTGLLWLLLLAALGAIGVAAAIIGLAAWRPDRALALLTRALAAILPRKARAQMQPFMLQFVGTLVAIIRRPRVLLVAAGYTGVAVLLDALFCALAFRAVDVSVAPLVVLYGYTFYNLAFILPTPPGQVGSNELIGLLIFSGLFGVNRAGVAAMFVFSHPWTALVLTGAGLWCLSVMGLSLRTTWRMTAGQAAGQAPPAEDDGQGRGAGAGPAPTQDRREQQIFALAVVEQRRRPRARWVRRVGSVQEP